jgi:hypothetical protein
MPARVVRVFHGAPLSQPYVEFIVTGTRPDIRAGRVGPHGYRTGETYTMPSAECPPRDCVYYVGEFKRVAWYSYDIEVTP